MASSCRSSAEPGDQWRPFHASPTMEGSSPRATWRPQNLGWQPELTSSPPPGAQSLHINKTRFSSLDCTPSGAPAFMLCFRVAKGVVLRQGCPGYNAPDRFASTFRTDLQPWRRSPDLVLLPLAGLLGSAVPRSPRFSS